MTEDTRKVVTVAKGSLITVAWPGIEILIEVLKDKPSRTRLMFVAPRDVKIERVSREIFVGEK